MIKKIFMIILILMLSIMLFNKVVLANTNNKATMYIDDQTGYDSSNRELRIRGWVMSTTSNITIKAYIDDKEITTITRNEERKDVLNVIKGYGTKVQNPKPGFNVKLDISNMQDGNYTLKIVVIDNKNNLTLTQALYKFNLQKYPTTMYIDDQTGYDALSKQFRIRGWVMSTTSDITIKVYIDDKEITTITRNEERKDVLNLIKGYGTGVQNPKPGFNIKLDVSNIKDGNHVLKIVVTDNKENKQLKESSYDFYLKKYPTTMYIDDQTGYDAHNKQFRIRGWVMSTSSNITIKAYINDEQVTTITRNEERKDVLNVIKGYGTAVQNPKPGFNVTIDASNKEEGSYKLKIVVLDKNSLEKLAEKQTTISLTKSKIKNGIDVSHHQGTIDWAKVKKDNVDFAILRAGYRGYGTSSDGINGKLAQDSKFDYNAKEAIKNGIPIGAYFFSQAINEKEAIEEANFMISIIKDYKMTYPVIIDVEYSGAPNYSGRADNVTKEMRTKICDAFLKVIKNAGYTPMIYADKYFATSNLDMSKLSQYQFWLAHYTGATKDNPLAKPSDYKGNYKIWQYTSKGRVNGIIGDVDMNISF